MSLRASYTLFAPLYDRLVARATEPARRASLARLAVPAGGSVLILGIGTGLDIPWLPAGPLYRGIDLTPAMLERARPRAAARAELRLELAVGDAQALELPAASVDAVVAHLIIAVVPDPARALAEVARVLRPGGRLLLLDKFLRPNQRAPLRRLVSPLFARFASHTDVVFETIRPPELRVLHDDPALAGGWFRRFVLEKEQLPDACCSTT
ncbi:class I SAM-dependent methyltransferase [Plasticicumulans acidivorans]|uniref:Methyltransferase family protein n=1 Tax=Plasticicumulans acidivorans TaxID=886464 RepID=A0A317MWZ9_9GAMM|nr:methyltransferase domain-containing protein [Plasticicumulans acidivorans]PWV62338.1 methyltransferase family protein [Plasticicumulans acidivorans]